MSGFLGTSARSMDAAPFDGGVSATLSMARILSERSARFRSNARSLRRVSCSRYDSESKLASWALEVATTAGEGVGDTESEFLGC